MFLDYLWVTAAWKIHSASSRARDIRFCEWPGNRNRHGAVQATEDDFGRWRFARGANRRSALHDGQLDRAHDTDHVPASEMDESGAGIASRNQGRPSLVTCAGRYDFARNTEDILGPLFFASTSHFLEKFEIQSDPVEVIVDFKNSRVFDHSGIEAIKKLTQRYAKIGKRIRLRHLSPDRPRLLDKAGMMIEVNHFEDPHYAVVER